MRTNYPWQINSVIHKSKATTKTLGIEAMLFSPKGEDDVRIPAAPLEMHEGYSRFKGVLIVKDSDSNKKVLTFNIPAKTVPYIHKRTEMLIENTILTNAMKKQNTEKKEESSKAYTVLIKSGKLKDKTPAEALLEDEKNLTLLNNQKKWLEQNLAKYPTNKEQIDAINEAIELHNNCELKQEKGSTHSIAGKPVMVYETPCKNIMPMDEEGRYTVYQISIKYNPGNNLPFELEVMNCFAPVDKSKGNEIIMSKAVNKQIQTIRLSEEEWFTMIDTMKAIKIMFENMNYPAQLALAAKISKENYESSIGKS